MAQHDYDINSTDSISGYQFRQDTNNALAAIKSCNSGAVAPINPVSGMLWLDTSTTPSKPKIRDEANTAWLDIYVESKMGAPIAAATVTNIGTFGSGEIVHITGTTAIHSFGYSTTGTRRVLIFDNTTTINHNATSLICAGLVSMSVIAGVVVEVICENGPLAYWRVVSVLWPSISINEIGYLDGVTSNIQAQINDKAPKISPVFTGTPSTPTAVLGTSTTQIATTAFVSEAIPGNIHAATAENPGDTDEFGFWDSLTLGLRKVTLASLKSIFFTSPTLTGAPLAPTATVGTNTTQLATTAFANAVAGGVNTPAASLATNGYSKSANGLIEQWGTTVNIPAGGSVAVTFSTPFSTQLFGVIATYKAFGSGSNNGIVAPQVTLQAVDGCTISNFDSDTGAPVFWFAKGY